MRKYISWRRVSTQKQGRSGLGLEAQEAIINYHAESNGGEIVADYVEVYTGTKLSRCAELRKAMEHAKSIGATLIIAKCDRFRNANEALDIYEEMQGHIFFCDCPSMDKTILTIMFAIYEREALNVSIRTKQSFDAKRKRGEKVGGREKGCKASAKAIDASVKRRKEDAQDNMHNRIFFRELKNWERKNGTIKTKADVKLFVEELNSHEFKTSKGLDFDTRNCWSMVYRARKLYSA